MLKFKELLACERGPGSSALPEQVWLRLAYKMKKITFLA